MIQKINLSKYYFFPIKFQSFRLLWTYYLMYVGRYLLEVEILLKRNPCTKKLSNQQPQNFLFPKKKKDDKL